MHVVDGAWVDHVVSAWPHDHLPQVPSLGVLPDATTHPLIRWYSVTGSSAAQVLGRGPREVAPTGMAAEWSAFARHFGITHQLSLPLRTGNGMEAYMVSRPDDARAHADADADLATLVLTALTALVRQHGVLHDAPGWRCDRARAAGLSEREFAVLMLLGEGPPPRRSPTA